MTDGDEARKREILFSSLALCWHRAIERGGGGKTLTQVGELLPVGALVLGDHLLELQNVPLGALMLAHHALVLPLSLLEEGVAHSENERRVSFLADPSAGKRVDRRTRCGDALRPASFSRRALVTRPLLPLPPSISVASQKIQASLKILPHLGDLPPRGPPDQLPPQLLHLILQSLDVPLPLAQLSEEVKSPSAVRKEAEGEGIGCAATIERC